jgi:membrane associated rhomboid family serine protease
MPRLGSSPFAFPDFTGATRRLILINLGTFFALLVAQLAFREQTADLALSLSLIPGALLHGSLWQPLTYSFIHPSLLGTLFELLSLWFLAGFLEMQGHSASWVIGLYAASVLGTAAAALAIYVVGGTLGYAVGVTALYGCFGGIFGLLAAIGLLYGDTQFLMFFVIGIKARYLVIIYALISIAMLFGEQRMYAFAELGGALAGLLWVKVAPRRGISFKLGFTLSESWYGLRNRYYRWKRRRAARKFEVYMKRQGRTVRYDGQGRQIDEDHDDKKRWN